MSDNIHINLPDGSSKEVPKGTTALDIARSISPRLADAALVAKVKPSALSTHGTPGQVQHSALKETGGGTGAAGNGEKTPASMHSAPSTSNAGWQFADLTKPLEEDVELR